MSLSIITFAHLSDTINCSSWYKIVEARHLRTIIAFMNNIFLACSHFLPFHLEPGDFFPPWTRWFFPTLNQVMSFLKRLCAMLLKFLQIAFSVPTATPICEHLIWWVHFFPSLLWVIVLFVCFCFGILVRHSIFPSPDLHFLHKFFLFCPTVLWAIHRPRQHQSILVLILCSSFCKHSPLIGI